MLLFLSTPVIISKTIVILHLKNQFSFRLDPIIDDWGEREVTVPWQKAYSEKLLETGVTSLCMSVIDTVGNYPQGLLTN